MINIDIRNNKKLAVDRRKLEELGNKLAKFKKLRFFNIEHKNLDLRSPELRKAYYKMIVELPKTMEMFNNARTMYLWDEVQAYN